MCRLMFCACAADDPLLGAVQRPAATYNTAAVADSQCDLDLLPRPNCKCVVAADWKYEAIVYAYEAAAVPLILPSVPSCAPDAEVGHGRSPFDSRQQPLSRCPS